MLTESLPRAALLSLERNEDIFIEAIQGLIRREWSICYWFLPSAVDYFLLRQGDAEGLLAYLEER
jgi:hypothetical protein